MFRPMKAATCEDSFLKSLRFPLYASVKLDGIRCVITPEGPVTNTLKPIRNDYIRETLHKDAFIGLDGELCLASSQGIEIPDTSLFSNVSSAIMSNEGEPAFVFWCFDLCFEPSKATFLARKVSLEAMISTFKSFTSKVQLLPQTVCTTRYELERFESDALSCGYEGIMLRSPEGLYKCGRSTLKEQWLLKRKPFLDEEATVVGLVEAKENTNEKMMDTRGLAKRSQKQDGKVAKGTLGGLIMRSPKWGEFTVGTGTLTKKQAQDIWNHPETVLGRVATFKYQGYGSKDKPRIPVLKGFRDPSDLPFKE